MEFKTKHARMISLTISFSFRKNLQAFYPLQASNYLQTLQTNQ
jgi:hypothetical protein